MCRGLDVPPQRSAAEYEESLRRGLAVFSKWTQPQGTTYHQFVGRVDGDRPTGAQSCELSRWIERGTPDRWHLPREPCGSVDAVHVLSVVPSPAAPRRVRGQQTGSTAA